MSSTIDCPYCDHEHDGCDVHEAEEDFICSECGKYFDVEVEHDPYYSTSKKDCPKEPDHKWGEWDQWFTSHIDKNKELRSKHCSFCDQLKVESRQIEAKK